jgi:N-carbamoylputrescine amidase
MKFKIAAIQPGEFDVKNDTYKSYMKKQADLLRKCVSEESIYLAVFPEMMTGAYFGMVKDKKWFNNSEDFETGPTTEMMISLAKECNTHIVYSFYEKDTSGSEMKYYNSVGVVSPTRGIIGHYRKFHIPAISDPSVSKINEKYYFSASNLKPEIIVLDNGTRLGTLICYDRSFPELWRVYNLMDADIISVSICTMGARKNMFTQELTTRAFETHTFVIAANRCGVEQLPGEESPRNHFGYSSIYSPVGEQIAFAGSTPWSYIIADFDSEVKDYSNIRWNFRRDRRPDIYGPIVDTSLIPEMGFEDMQ